MSLNLPISFPSEAERIRRQVEIQRDWTPTQRIAAVCESVDVINALAAAGGKAAEQFEYRQRCKRQSLQKLKEFMAKHADATTDR
jgi:hypothetical protein